jgi:hypothetical protein
MARSILSSSLAVAAGLGLFAALCFGGAGCQSKEEAFVLVQDDGSSRLSGLKAGIPLARIQELCNLPPRRLVAVGETANASDEPVTGAYYFADLCPDCGGVREVFCTLYFDKSDRLLRWHPGRIGDGPLAATSASTTN